MKQYQLDLIGLSPLLLHNDNISFTEKVRAWWADPGNKKMVDKGDDRSPAWTWMGYLYHNGKNIGLPSDNIMTMLREAGAKVSTGKANQTYKKATQAGLLLDREQMDLTVGDGKPIPIKPIWDSLMGVSDPNRFYEHVELVEEYGFELLVKRAAVGNNKHVRVRPMFRTWTASGTITVFDEETSGLTKEVLKTILNQGGSMVGIGDWRPSANKAGTFGRFEAHLTEL